MQISSTSHSLSYRFRCRFSARGFSVIELLISTAIIALISAAVMVKFSAFDSTTLLKSLAYEVASTLRTAQVYSISVVGSNNNFNTPYGVTFAPLSSTYTVFRFYDPGNQYAYPRFDDDNYGATQYGNVSIVNEYTMGRNMRIEDVCVSVTGSPTLRCDLSRLDISFRRPEFKAIFYGVPESGTIDQSTISDARIKLRSSLGGDTWIVKIGLLGHISACKANEAGTDCI